MSDTPTITADDAASLLRWWLDAGVTDALAEAPTAWMTPPAPPKPAEPPPMRAPARPAAPMPNLDAIHTLAALEAAIDAFDGCALKATATKTVFADGDPASRLMLIGEAPEAEEDRAGKPFVGQAGQLLDRMMAAIGKARSNPTPGAFYITNMIFWRPPGNRPPTSQEIHACLPFVLRHIELVDPVAILTLGAVPFQALVNTTEGITRARGAWRTLDINGKSYPLLPTLHPAFLLRQPGQKVNSWQDLLSLRKFLGTGET